MLTQLKIEILFSETSGTTGLNFYFFHNSVPHNVLYQNNTESSALLNTKAATAKNRNILIAISSLTTGPNKPELTR